MIVRLELTTRSLALASALLLSTGAASSGQTSADDMYLEARQHLLEERYPQALDLFRRVRSQHPESSRAEDALYWIGYTFESMGRNREAIQAYTELIESSPDSLRAESARERRGELVGRESPPADDLARETFRSSSSWEVKRDTALSLARQGDLSGADVLEEVMRRESSGRQLELLSVLAPQIQDPAARRIVVIGLEPSLASTVQLRTLEALESAVRQPEVLRAFDALIASNTSSSVKLKAIQVLAGSADDAAARDTLARALSEGNSSAVQIAACGALQRHLLDPRVRPAVAGLFQGATSSSVQLEILSALEGDKDRPEIVEVLRPAVENNNSTSVKLKATSIAGDSSRPEVRAVARAALAPGVSSSVQLRAVQALSSGSNDRAAAAAIEELFRAGDVSTSVQLAALTALSHHMETEPAGPALAGALRPTLSTSVQLKAIELAVPYVRRPEVKAAVVGLLADGSTSTSVQLKAVQLLREDVVDAEVRTVVRAALRSSNSTSVQLQAVDALSSQSGHSEVRESLAATLTREYSTSVVLSAMEPLDPYVLEDVRVKSAYVRAMEDARMSSTVRIRAAQRLVAGADSALKGRIGAAMEETILRLSHQSRSRSGHGDLLEDAFEVLEQADPERAERLKQRYGDRGSLFWNLGGSLAQRAGLGEVWEGVDTLTLWAGLVWRSRELERPPTDDSARGDQ